MKTPNKILMTNAREALKDKWGLAIGGYLVYGLLNEVATNSLVGMIVLGPLSVGLSIFSLSFSRKKDPSINQLFDGFNNFATSLLAYILVMIFVLLWMLLLIIPGIIAAISYSQTFFIIAEDDKIDAMSALRKSQKMMKGNKWKYFCLQCRFIGWFLLALLTFGIGFLWLIPYIHVSYANFYDDVKELG